MKEQTSDLLNSSSVNTHPKISQLPYQSSQGLALLRVINTHAAGTLNDAMVTNIYRVFLDLDQCVMMS